MSLKNFTLSPAGIIILLLFCIPVTGQQDNIKFSNISIKDGLSQSSPNCIFQDSKGIMWIGTDDGLNKYDGYTFTVFKPLPGDPFSISNSRILCIAEDSTGNLWIGTNGGGLNKYDRKKDRFYTINVNVKNTEESVNVVNCIMPYDSKYLWAGTGSGMYMVDYITGDYTLVSRKFEKLSSLDKMPVHSVIRDHNTVWIGTDGGLLSFEPESNDIKSYALNEPVMCLLVDKQKNIVIGTQNGLALLRKETGIIEKPSLKNSINTSDLTVKALLEDNSGNLWVATFGSGLFIGLAETGIFVNYIYDHLNPYSIKNNEVLSLFMDYAGLIWAGSNGIDIYSPKKEKFVLYDYVPYSTEKLIFRNVHPIYVDEQGVLWVGSKSDGLHILDRANKKYTHWIHRTGVTNGLSSNRVRAIKEFPRGTLWIGTDDAGVNKVILDQNRRPVSFSHFRYEEGNTESVTSDRIYTFYTGSDGKLWIGTDNGLSVMDVQTGKCRQYLPDTSNKASISNTTVYGIYEDSKGNVWLATDVGVNRYDPSTDGFIHYLHDDANKNTLIHNEVLCFHEDSKGNLWIGTYGKGVDKFNPADGSFTHYTDIPELETAVVYGILDDAEGNLWMSSNNGLFKFNEKSRSIKQFTIEDGLQSNEFNGTSYFESNQGEMFFGGQFGFNSFFPKDVKLDAVAPKIILADLQIRNISVVPGDHSPLIDHINVADEINLNYKQNNFTLYFSALHFENPLRNHYKYMLEGFDKEWIDAGNRRFVSYTNLPYKTYRFKVIASNSDGTWNEKGISVKIRVRPPFWATLWFRILAVLLLAGLVFFIIRRRITQEERQKRLIEEKFQASSKELEAAREQLEQQHSEIVIQKRELIVRQKDQENLLWFNQGLGIFSDLISKNREDLTELCRLFIEKLVDYVEAQQGSVFLINEDDETNSCLELVAGYCLSSDRLKQQFKIGEGYVGCCFKDRKFVEIDNVSDKYSKVNSGLGSMPVKHLILGPLVVNNECIGVIELGSFKKIKGYRITFIEKLLETFSSTILTEQSNKRLKRLIEQSTRQARDLAENEERIRKSMEELMAAHEESSRREDELVKLAEESATNEEMLNQEIEQLKIKLAELTGKKES
jgi:ligand-binding sensor domain-containing protein